MSKYVKLEGVNKVIGDFFFSKRLTTPIPLKEAINALPSIDEEWVSVETPPETDTPVLVHTDLDYTGYGYRCDQTFWMLEGVGITDNVTHWRKLPQPPTK